MTTPALNLQELSSTAGERILINENYAVLDAVLSRVLTADINLTDFPTSPVKGRTILLAAAIGSATGLTGHLAVFTGSAWVTVPPSTTGPVVPTQVGHYAINTTQDSWEPFTTTATPDIPSIANNIGIRTEERTLTGNVTLVDTDGTHQYIDPNGANRVVVLDITGTDKKVDLTVIGNTAFTVELQDDLNNPIATLVDQTGQMYKAEVIYSASNINVTLTTRA